MTDLYHVHWYSRITGHTGHGTAAYPLAVAQRLADDFNRQDADIQLHHYVLPANTSQDKPEDKD